MNVKDNVKILIVDDVDINLDILEEIIKSMGYETVTALSVKEAIALIEEMEELPQLILSDISMPEIDGYAFCGMLKKNPHTRHIPVIFISAMDSVSDLGKGFSLGAVDYIPKPFEPAEVQMRINTHLKMYQMQVELVENNKRLNQVVANQIEKLHAEQKNIMSAMAKLVESRENVTGEHYWNISYNSKILAQGMQFHPLFEDVISDNFIDTIESSAYLHDIGKIRIPDYILLKNGHLTSEEMAVMRTHAKIGAETLLDIYEGKEKNDFLNMAVEIAYYHHENWDGSGYPKGLKGEEIPLAARIVHLVDVFDALTGDRIYNNAYTLEESLEIIASESGKAFDPDIVDVFLKIHRNMIRDHMEINWVRGRNNFHL
ncbi:MAG: response regulator [Lachnospiraceae bacterium]|nr:response regulator [Lachnospiraceae bacterium]